MFCGDPDVAVTSVLKRYNLKLLKTKHMLAFSTRTNDDDHHATTSKCYISDTTGNTCFYSGTFLEQLDSYDYENNPSSFFGL